MAFSIAFCTNRAKLSSWPLHSSFTLFSASLLFSTSLLFSAYQEMVYCVILRFLAVSKSKFVFD